MDKSICQSDSENSLEYFQDFIVLLEQIIAKVKLIAINFKFETDRINFFFIKKYENLKSSNQSDKNNNTSFKAVLNFYVPRGRQN